jgi:hypothetical protein
VVLLVVPSRGPALDGGLEAADPLVVRLAVDLVPVDGAGQRPHVVELVPAGVLDDLRLPAGALDGGVGGLPVPAQRAAQHQVRAYGAPGQRRTEQPGLLDAARGQPVVVGLAPGRLAVPDQQQHAHDAASSMSRLQRSSR